MTYQVLIQPPAFEEIETAYRLTRLRLSVGGGIWMF